jgi:hypothetical protein
MFGLATIRTITPFSKDESFEKLGSFIARVLVASTMVMSYIWFLKQFVSLNGI